MLIVPMELLEQTANKLNTCTASMVGSQHVKSNEIIRLENGIAEKGEIQLLLKRQTKAEHAYGCSSKRLRNGQSGKQRQVQ